MTLISSIWKQKTLPVSICALAVLIALLYFASGIRSSLFSAGDQYTLSEGRTVTLTEEGFSPQRLVVKQGDTVQFVNATGKEAWPASDPHPTHNIYAAFDPRRPVPPGDTWTFTFITPGLWQYHDHLVPGRVGEIIVLDQRGAVVQKTCTDKDAPTGECFAEHINGVLADRGLEAALNEMSRLYETNPAFADWCHASAHTLGEAAYRIFAREGTMPLLDKASYCGFGFYHGFMETMLQESGDVAAAKRFCAEAARSLSGGAGNVEGACYHGIGHGAVDGADPRDWEDPKKLIAPGLALCERVDPTEPHFFRCASGAFDSLALLYINNAYGLRLAVADLYGVCASWKESRIRTPCLSEMNLPVFRQTGSDFTKSIILVERIENRIDSRLAMEGISRVLGVTMRDFSTDAFASIVNACHGARSDLVDPCITGIPTGILERLTVGNEYRIALRFCSQASLTEDERIGCVRAVFATAKSVYAPEKYQNVCPTIDEKYRPYCEDPRRGL